jgi:lipoate-protein ligase A
MAWQIIRSGCSQASVNMKRDYELLQQLQSTPHPIYHDYSWEGDCATYGHFIEPFDFLNAAAVAKHQLNLAKRPTGGGIVFHLSDLAFSVLLPASHPAYSLNTLANYAFVNQVVSQSISHFLGQKACPELLPHEPTPMDAACKNFCMAKPTKYDVMLNGRKVGGGAQRRTKYGYLHQGTIALAMPREDYLQEILQPETYVLAAMKQHSFLLLDSTYSPKQLEDARKELKTLLIDNFCASED